MRTGRIQPGLAARAYSARRHFEAAFSPPVGRRNRVASPCRTWRPYGALDPRGESTRSRSRPLLVGRARLRGTSGSRVRFSLSAGGVDTDASTSAARRARGTGALSPYTIDTGPMVCHRKWCRGDLASRALSGTAAIHDARRDPLESAPRTAPARDTAVASAARRCRFAASLKTTRLSASRLGSVHRLRRTGVEGKPSVRRLSASAPRGALPFRAAARHDPEVVRLAELESSGPGR